MTAPFFDPGPDRDACGVGFIAARDLAPTFRMTRLAVECLVNLDHRGLGPPTAPVMAPVS